MMNNYFFVDSEFNQRQRKNRKTIDDQLIPLINIVFLLLIFFLVAGQIEQRSTQDIEPPILQQESTSQRLDKHFLVNSSGDLYFGGEQIQLEKLHSIVEREFLATQEFVIKADKNITAKKLTPVIQALNANLSGSIRLVTVSDE